MLLQLVPDLTRILSLAGLIGDLEATMEWKRESNESINEELMKINETNLELKFMMNRLRLAESEKDCLMNEAIEHKISVKNNKIEEICLENRPMNHIYDNKAAVNLSNVYVPDFVMEALSLGPKFVTNCEEDSMNFIASIAEGDNIIKNYGGFTHDTIRMYMKKVVENTHNKNQLVPWYSFIINQTKSYVENNEEIRAVQCDKGKIIAIMNTTDYHNEIDKLVNNEDYRILNMREILVIKSQHNAILRGLKRRKLISEFHYGLAIKQTNVMPKFYALPKLHKLKITNDRWETDNGIPMRPIVSCSGALNYTLTECITKILEEFFPKSEHNITNSVEFVQEIRKVILKEGQEIFSFDIVAMFTSLPHKRIIKIIEGKKTEIVKKYDFEFIMSAVRYIIEKGGVFSVNNVIYQQSKGVGMGTCISPFFARIIYEDILKHTAEKIKFNPEYFGFYVDDSAAIMRRDEADLLLRTLNNYDTNIKFTMENETNGKINFLNTTIIRENKEIKTNWYKKPFASDRLVNYYSGHEPHTIIGTAKTFIHTMLQLSDEAFFHDNKQIAIEVLRKNNFPEGDIIGLMNKYYTLMKITTKQKTEKRIKRYNSLPWLPNKMPIIRSVLQKYCEVQLSGRPIRNTVINKKIKDTSDINTQFNKIVLFNCNCRKKFDISFSGEKTVGEIKDEITSKNKCKKNKHFFKKSYIIRTPAKNAAAESVTEMLAYANQDLLVKQYKPPHRYWMNLIDSNKKLREKLRFQ